MSSIIASRVMDQREQQKVHPFFENFSKISRATDQRAIQTPPETTHEHLAVPAQSSSLGPQHLYNESASSENTLEEDPNAERRKRLKTAVTVTEPVDMASETNSSLVRDTSASSLREDPAMPSSDPPRKTLKLNINGKLLNFPLAPTQHKAHNKLMRGKPQSNQRNASRKVIIKYETESEIGKKIDGIINGQERHTVHQKLPEERITAKKNDLPKATHPFFLSKKPQRGSSESSEICQKTTTPACPTDSAKASASLPKATFSSSLFQKQPSPVMPLWPPRELVHVKGMADCSSDAPKETRFGQRKSKQRAVQINDSENVLTYEYHKAYNEAQSQLSEAVEPALRVPIRATISGHTLRKRMQSKVLHGIEAHLTDDKKLVEHSGHVHPCIAKLYTDIVTSVTPFDSGSCDSAPWTQKYSPKCAEDVLQAGPEARMLRDWLRELMVSSKGVENLLTSKSKGAVSGSRKSKKRKTANKLDGFIVSSEDESSEMDSLNDSEDDELTSGLTISSKRTVVRVGDSIGRFKKGEQRQVTNAVLISGPNGCGKSASVYAVAKELDYEVFEINSGTRRNARDILERVGDMTQNHLVHLDSKGEPLDLKPEHTGIGLADDKQNTVNMFFKIAAQKKAKDGRTSSIDKANKKSVKEEANGLSRSHKQSLILLEEVDILFGEDKQFWMGVLTLIEKSKRPVIMTCNDESLVPLHDLSLHAILRYHTPPPNLAINYLLLVAANEGHMLGREAVSTLYSASHQDLRKSIMQLDFWCQMTVGSQKSGIDWILDRWPVGTDLDPRGNKLKVISLHTYQSFMGWFDREIGPVDQSLTKESELLLEGLNWWQLDFHTEDDVMWSQYPSLRSNEQQTRLASLQEATRLTEVYSALDTLSSTWSLDQNQDNLDTTIIQMSDKDKANYQDDYPLLVAHRKPDYTGFSADLGSTAYALARRVASKSDTLHDKFLTTDRILARESRSKFPAFASADYIDAFQPLMKPSDLVFQSSSRAAPSFDTISVIATDMAPYIRSIASYDLRLERFRDELDSQASQGLKKRKPRTTRASRAALEGGNKVDTRRERWFSSDANPKKILATGSRSWEDALAQIGQLPTFPALHASPRSTQIDTDSPNSTEDDVEKEPGEGLN